MQVNVEVDTIVNDERRIAEISNNGTKCLERIISQEL